MGGQSDKKQPPDYPWHRLEVLPGQKQTRSGGLERGGGANEQEGNLFKKSALIVFLYQEADLARDRDSVLWTSCSSDGSWVYFCGSPSLPPTPLYPSIPPSFPSTATPLVCFLSKTCLIFPDWTATSEMPKRTWHPSVDRTQLFI